MTLKAHNHFLETANAHLYGFYWEGVKGGLSSKLL